MHCVNLGLGHKTCFTGNQDIFNKDGQVEELKTYFHHVPLYVGQMCEELTKNEIAIAGKQIVKKKKKIIIRS